ncbi:hypothetical protein B0H13DRAFT_1854651 [Mycena leptocephala]|nr:hypothetical protein B0H13DRAFT_1854651 [Mycena leptocephala]
MPPGKFKSEILLAYETKGSNLRPFKMTRVLLRVDWEKDDESDIESELDLDDFEDEDFGFKLVEMAEKEDVKDLDWLPPRLRVVQREKKGYRLKTSILDGEREKHNFTYLFVNLAYRNRILVGEVLCSVKKFLDELLDTALNGDMGRSRNGCSRSLTRKFTYSLSFSAPLKIFLTSWMRAPGASQWSLLWLRTRTSIVTLRDWRQRGFGAGGKAKTSRSTGASRSTGVSRSTGTMGFKIGQGEGGENSSERMLHRGAKAHAGNILVLAATDGGKILASGVQAHRAPSSVRWYYMRIKSQSQVQVLGMNFVIVFLVRVRLSTITIFWHDKRIRGIKRLNALFTEITNTRFPGQHSENTVKARI